MYGKQGRGWVDGRKIFANPETALVHPFWALSQLMWKFYPIHSISLIFSACQLNLESAIRVYVSVLLYTSTERKVVGSGGRR